MDLREHELHIEFQRAFDIIEKDVCGTMGAAGGSVIVDNPNVAKDGIPYYFTKDGITVLRQMVGNNDPIVSKAAMLMLSAINKQHKEVGDGTTAATLLTCAFYKALCKELENGANVHQVVKDAKDFVGEVVEKLKEQAQPCDSLEKLIRIATISANNDKVLGGIIGKAIYDVGKYGTIDVSRHDLPYTEVEITKGYVISGIADPYMANIHGNYYFESTDVKPKVILTLDIIDRTDEAKELLLLYQKTAMAAGKHIPFVVVCTDISPNPLSVIKTNQELSISKGVEPQQIFFIRHQKEGQERIEYMQDLARISGATVLSKHSATPIVSKTHKIDEKHLGEVDWMKTSSIQTILKFDSDLTEYVKQIENEIESAEVTDDRKKWLKSRIARLIGSIGFMRVGAMTKQEQLFNDDLVDDAVRNTKAAFEDGYLLGGGLALRNIANDIIVNHPYAEVLYAPNIKVQQNAGILEPKIYISQSMAHDLFTGENIDYDKAGIYDSFRGVKTALEVAVSLASEFAKTYKMEI